MNVARVREGLWQWTAPHPGWTPDTTSWGPDVASHYLEAEVDGRPGVLLFDPLVPREDAAAFWSALDRDVERRGGPVAILIGNSSHGRSADAIRERYADGVGAETWAHEKTLHEIGARVTRPFRAGDVLPGGVRALEVAGFWPGEVVYHVPDHAALVAADALLGAGDGGLLVAPRNWAPQEEGRYERELLPFVHGLLELPFDCVLTAHGPSALADGRRRLADALAAAREGRA